jgi:hypothetical protein
MDVSTIKLTYYNACGLFPFSTKLFKQNKCNNDKNHTHHPLYLSFF